MANIGYSPTFGNEVLSVEVHIMDLNADLYLTSSSRSISCSACAVSPAFRAWKSSKPKSAGTLPWGGPFLALPEARLV